MDKTVLPIQIYAHQTYQDEKDKSFANLKQNEIAEFIIAQWATLTPTEQKKYNTLKKSSKKQQTPQPTQQPTQTTQPTQQPTQTTQQTQQTQQTTPQTPQTRNTKYYELLYANNIKTGLNANLKLEDCGTLNKSKVEKYNIVLVSSTLYNEFAFYLRNDDYYVNRVVIDEADSIKISGALQINSLFYWFITSSISTLFNPLGSFRWEDQIYTDYNGTQRVKQVKVKEGALMSTGFIRNTFEKINMDPENKLYIGNLIIKNDDSFVEASFKLPDPIINIIVCQDNFSVKVLKGIVSADLIQMLNAGNLDGALNQVNCEMVSESNIINAVTKKLELDLQNQYIKLEMKKKTEYQTPKAKEEAIKRSNERIEEIKHKIHSIEERIKQSQFCEICYDDINNPSITKCCQSVFCFECLIMALSSVNNCPKCRSQLNIDQLILIRNKIESIKENIEKPDEPIEPEEIYKKEIDELIITSEQHDKYTNLEKILESRKKLFDSLPADRQKKYKILIFSEYDNSFNSKVINILNRLNLSSDKIKGNSMIINKVLTNYKEGNLNVLLVNSRYFGSGINLENTSDVIIMHRMGADLQKQVIGRAQRLGRTFPLHIWKLYNSNEHE
jgi:hypothetical protein